MSANSLLPSSRVGVSRRCIAFALRFISLGLVLSAAPGAAQPVPGSRVALVIGNGTYANVPSLPNPVRDAELVATSLREAGFQTVQVENNRSKAQFEAALKKFGERAEAAEVAVVYFAGHGLESRGQNWLLPVDAKLARESDLGLEAIRLEDVLEMAQRASRMRIVILDACRDNPFSQQMRRLDPTRSVTRGLARTLEVSDSLVVYAAKGGTVAQDGSGSNSPFARAFSRRLLEPGVELRLMLGRVRDDVLAATSGQQEPFSYGSLGGAEFYFRPGRTAAAQQGVSTFDARTAELIFLNAAGSDRGLLQSYLDRVKRGEFPGTYREIAEARLRPNPQLKPQPAPLTERFEVVAQGVLDRQQGVIWAARDNGAKVSWLEARLYCGSLDGGWDMATVAQLQSLHDASGAFARQINPYIVRPATDRIEITGVFYWSTETNGSADAWAVGLDDGRRISGPMSTSDFLRALCVRRS